MVPYGGVDQTAEMFEFPWQVIIKTDEPGAVSNPITCEASIIDKFWVITSVNCVNQTQMEKFTLRFGKFTSFFKVTIFYCKVLFFVLASYKLKNPDKFEFSRKINKIVVHPNFNPLTLNSNIALLKLPSELPFGNVSAHVSAICLPAMERDIDEQANLIKIATISGWNKQKVVEELLTTNVTILKQSECVVPAKSVTQENICSRGQLSTGLACNHFNGGPLITYDNLKNQWQLIGVASFSECSTFPVPNVYTRVSKYLDWIMKTMSEN